MLSMLLSVALAVPSMSVTEPVAGGHVVAFIDGDPGTTVVLYASTAGAPTPCTTAWGTACLSLVGPTHVLGAWVLDGHGRATAVSSIPAGLSGRSVAFEALSIGATVEATGAVVRTVLPAGSDPDQDGLSTAREVALGTDPNLADSDGDTVKDGEEVLRFGTDPNHFDPGLVGGGADIDGDGLPDSVEFTVGTDAWVPDTDGDGLNDYDEVVVHGTDPLLVDGDGDGLWDADELLSGTDPNDPDSDGGGAHDGDEATYGTDPFDASDDVHAGPDIDGDGLIDSEEFARGTDAWIPDTDGDGLLDGEEVWVHGTNPLLADTDGDGLADDDELLSGTDPNDPDTDGGGAYDGDEATYGTDPFDASDDVHAGPDIDGDGLIDSEEFARGTDAWIPDTDGDGLWDGEEVWVYGTDPLLADSDGGGVGDGGEVLAGTDPHDPGDG